MSVKMEDLPADALPVDQIDGIYKYITSIDWTEPWLQGLLLFHLATFFLIVLFRRSTLGQTFIFATLLICVSGTERLNEYLATNYKRFSRQQYFDSHGMFISLLFSLPALCNCIAILINWFLVSGQMLVAVKRKQLKQETKKKK